MINSFMESLQTPGPLTARARVETYQQNTSTVLFNEELEMAAGAVVERDVLGTPLRKKFFRKSERGAGIRFTKSFKN